MLQHAGIEVKPADLDRTLEFFAILGFTVVPDPFDGGFTWVECAGTQIHLMHEDDPIVPPRAHVAVVRPHPAAKARASRSNAAASTGASPAPSRSPPAATASS